MHGDDDDLKRTLVSADTPPDQAGICLDDRLLNTKVSDNMNLLHRTT